MMRRPVLKMFNDLALRTPGPAPFQFSSANSINIGRLIPQIVYYVWAWADVKKDPCRGLYQFCCTYRKFR